MSPRKLLLLAVALATGVGTLYVGRQFLSKPEPAPLVAEAPEAPKEPELRVLVAARSLPAGTLIKAEDLKWQVWDKADPNLPSLLAEGEAEPLDYRGAVVRRGIDAGAPIVVGRLVKPGEQGFLAAVLDAGQRAVSVPINGVTGLAGLVFPGDRVDLILTHTVVRPRDPNLSERRISETVLTDLRVLAIDQTVDDQTTAPQVGKIATLEVSPKQAELVVLMAELGQLSLSLRSLAAEAADDAGAGQPPAEAGESLALYDDPEALRLHNRAPLTAAALGLPAPALARPDPTMPKHPAQRRAEQASEGRAYSWDSDVSAVLPGPMDPKDSRQAVRVLRGVEAAEQVFDKQR